MDAGVVNDIGATHTAGDGRVDYDSAYEVTYVGGFATCRVYAYTHLAQTGEEFFGTVDDGRNDFARYEMLVTAYCR